MENNIYGQKAWLNKFISKGPQDADDEERACKILDMIPSEVKTVLDVGIGGGYIYRRLNNRNGLRCFGVDISSDVVKMAEDSSLLVGDAGSLPFKNGGFDLVLAANLIEHIKNERFDEAISEIIRVSKKYILINSPYKDAIDWPVSFCNVCKKEFNIYDHMRSVDMRLMTRIFPKDRFDFIKVEVFGKKRDARPSFLVRLARLYGKVYSMEGAICPNCLNTIITLPPRNIVQNLFGKAICAAFFLMDRFTPSIFKEGSEMCILLRKKMTQHTT